MLPHKRYKSIDAALNALKSLGKRQKPLAIAQKAIGYRFKQPDLLWEALQAAGADITPPEGNPEGNKQLALIGDKLLGLRLAMLGRERGERREQITGRISIQAGNQRLHDICDASGLTACIQSNPSQKDQLGVKTKTATVEAVIAAAHYDGGFDAAETVIRNLKII